MRCEIKGETVDVQLWHQHKDIVYDFETIADLPLDSRHWGFANIEGVDCFLKFQEGIDPAEPKRIAQFANHTNFVQLLGTERLNKHWEILITKRCPGKPIPFFNRKEDSPELTHDDGIIILDQYFTILKKILKEDMTFDKDGIAVDIGNPHNFVYDKETQQLVFTDFASSKSPWPYHFFYFTHCLADRKLVNPTMVEDCITQYFRFLYDLIPKNIERIKQIENKLQSLKIGHPYQTIRITHDYYMQGSRAIQPRMRLLNLGNLRNKNVLDLGCANGGLCIEAKRRDARIVTGYDTNIDLVRTATELAKEVFPAAPFKDHAQFTPRVDFFQAELSDLTPQKVYEDSKVDKFDIVFLLSVWPYIKDKPRFYEFLRALKFNVLYWEGNYGTPTAAILDIIHSTEIFSSVEFLGYADIYAGRLNGRPLFKCRKKRP